MSFGRSNLLSERYRREMPPFSRRCTYLRDSRGLGNYAKLLQQFVVIQQVGGIFRMADRLLIDQVGFKNDVTLGFESFWI